MACFTSRFFSKSKKVRYRALEVGAPGRVLRGEDAAHVDAARLVECAVECAFECAAPRRNRTIRTDAACAEGSVVVLGERRLGTRESMFVCRRCLFEARAMQAR